MQSKLQERISMYNKKKKLPTLSFYKKETSAVPEKKLKKNCLHRIFEKYTRNVQHVQYLTIKI